jgi:hypothetical protein
MSFSVFDAERDRAPWELMWGEWMEREPSAHPAYASLFAREGDRCICFAYKSARGSVLFPVIERPLASEPWATAGEKAVDLVTPYGYGGPFCFDADDRQCLADEFWSAFFRWADDRGAVSLFGRLSLFDDQLLSWPRGVFNRQENVVRRLDCTREELWRDYAHKVRKNVNRARRAGLVVELANGATQLDEFCAVYESTMDRNQASRSYYFSRSFFESIVRDLPTSHALFHVRDATRRVVSTELVLASTAHLYSFLGGTRAESFADRPNDLLKHAICEWGIDTGRSAFVLGGGYGGEDGIFRYKRSFAPNGVVMFRVGELVIDAHQCERLTETRRRHEGSTWQPRHGYFPPYRS